MIKSALFELYLAKNNAVQFNFFERAFITETYQF